MQISLKWINELIDSEQLCLNELIDKLTMGGFEVEEILQLEINNRKEIILDISATANRYDSLSIQGISSEIGTLLNKPLKKLFYSTTQEIWKTQLEDLVETFSAESNCNTFLALKVENLIDLKAPNWLKEKLISLGIKPTNDLLDFQNYILLETGYPFVFYDFEKIKTKLNSKTLNISILNPKSSIHFLASNDINYELKKSNELITINNIPISIAGIIESKDFICSNLTQSILIEASIFNPAKIRQQSRELGLRTDQSARQEKYLKNTYLIESTYRLISLLRINNPNLQCKLLKFIKAEQALTKPILLKYDKINETLGPILTKTETGFNYIAPELINSYLNQLNFRFSYDNQNLIWNIKIPDLRSDDIKRDIDIIEEIGRLHGFNNFLTTLPKLKKLGNEDLSYKTRKKITSCLLNLGLNELTHYSLVNETTFFPTQVKLINPLLSDCANLRVSLIPNLIKTIDDNLKKGNSIIEGFEYGHVFSKDKNHRFQEKENIAGIFGGGKKKLSWSENFISLNWFEAKGKMEQLFEQLNIFVNWKKLTNTEIIFHPYKTSELSLIDGTKFGVFGQISSILSNQLNIDPEIYIFELDLLKIQNQIQKNKLTVYKTYVLYPKIIKDISFVIHQTISFAELKKLLYANGTKFLSEIHLLDEYRGKSIPDQYTSLCLQFVFQSNYKTLQTKEIEIIMKSFELILTEKFNALIRT
jgi:phenylalanyl-tRNA synthetase beta chain